MNQNLTEFAAIVDQSGSMSSVKDDAIGGFNEFLKSQKALPGDAYMTLTTFNDEVKIKPRMAIKDVKEFDDDSFYTSGCTALRDAIGLTIDLVGKNLAAMDEKDRPGKVIVAILTDGAENASKLYDGEKVRKMIETQRDTYSWEFIFLAAGLEAFEEARSIGMDMSKTAMFVNDAIGNTAAYSALCSYATDLRSAKSVKEYSEIRTSVNLQSVVDANIDSSKA